MYQPKKAGEILKKLRGGRPRREVAEKLGISESALTMYENGERSPRDEVKVALATYYNTSVGEIFFAQ